MKIFKVILIIFIPFMLICTHTSLTKDTGQKPDLIKTKKYRSEDIIKDFLIKILPDLIERIQYTDINLMRNEFIPGHFEVSPDGKIWGNVEFGIDGIWNEHFLGSMLDINFKDIGHEGLVTVVNFVFNRIEPPPYFSVGKITLSYEATTRYHVFRAIFKKQIDFRNAYHKRLKVKKDLKGMITLKIGIDNLGKVAYADIAESSMNDTIFENDVLRIAKRWKFIELVRETKDTIVFSCPYIFSR